jgi:hypothetical protein
MLVEPQEVIAEFCGLYGPKLADRASLDSGFDHSEVSSFYRDGWSEHSIRADRKQCGTNMMSLLRRNKAVTLGAGMQAMHCHPQSAVKNADSMS